MTKSIDWSRTTSYVLGAHAARLASTFAAISPIENLVQRGVAGLRDGDTALFARGGVMLLEFVRVQARSLEINAGVAATILGLTWVVSLAMTSLVLSSMTSSGEQRFPFVMVRSLRALGSHATLVLLTTAAAAIVGGMSYLLGYGASLIVEASFCKPAADFVWLGVACAGFVVSALAVAVCDIARGLVLSQPASTTHAFVEAVLIVRHHAGSVLASMLSRTTLAVLAIVSSVTMLLSLDMTNTVQAVLAIVIQQITLVLLAFVRASWLASATTFGKKHARTAFALAS